MFDTGILQLATYGKQSADGQMPRETLTVYGSAFFGDRTVTYTRLYQARGADSQIDRLVRVPFDTVIPAGGYVILEDGSQYRVDAVSDVIVGSSTRARELTLIKVEDLFNVDLAD